jgi:hypothetical protein
MSLEDALEQRLQVINCTPTDIQAFLRAHPPESRLTPVGSAVPCHGAAAASAEAACAGAACSWPAGAELAWALSCLVPTARLLAHSEVFCSGPACLPACLVQGARELIQQLQNRGVAVYLIR